MIKKIKILEYIHNFIVVDKYIIYELFNYKRVHGAYKVLYFLEKNKFLKSSKPFTFYNTIYTTSYKTNNLLSRKNKVYNINNSYNVLHELFLSYIVIFFVKKYNYKYYDLIPNRLCRTFWSEHIPDLLININDEIIYIEYERSSKNIERLEENIIKNNISCDKQIWICENNYIYNNVIKIFKDFNIQGQVLKKEVIIDYLKGKCADENYKLYF